MGQALVCLQKFKKGEKIMIKVILLIMLLILSIILFKKAIHNYKIYKEAKAKEERIKAFKKKMQELEIK